MIEISADDLDVLESVVHDGEGARIAYYTAPWCVPCKMLKPRLEQLEEKNQWLTVVRIDVESNPELAKVAGIMSVPTLDFYGFGRAWGRLIGAVQNTEIQKILDTIRTFDES